MGQIQKYQVHLSDEERGYLHRHTSSGNWEPRKVKRAFILLKADRGQGNSLEDDEIVEQLHCSPMLVTKVRQSFGKGKRLKALDEKHRTGRPKTIDGEIEAHIIAIACSSPPEGRIRWMLQLIADQVIALTELESFSHMSVARTLKKMNLSLG
jgi:hypothetical protein